MGIQGLEALELGIQTYAGVGAEYTAGVRAGYAGVGAGYPRHNYTALMSWFCQPQDKNTVNMSALRHAKVA